MSSLSCDEVSSDDAEVFIECTPDEPESSRFNGA